MRGIQAAIAAFVVAGSIMGGVSSASAQFRIADDRGGQIGAYLHQFAMIRDSGSRVVIDGTCLSACTLVLGTVPRERICVTPRASLGFHAAWNPAPGGRTVFSAEGTRLLWEVYPGNVRNWIRSKGGLTAKMIYLRGKELSGMYASCPPTGQTVAANTPTTPRTGARAGSGRTVYAATQAGM